MDSFLCIAAVGAIIIFSLFMYFLNTGRKKVKVGGKAGKKEYTPVYVSIADKPDAIIRGMNKFVADSKKTETAGDKWRWIPMLIFAGSLGLILLDALLYLLGYKSFVFTIGAVLVWIAAFVLSQRLRKSDSLAFSPRYAHTKEIMHTLRDDLKPGTTFLGHLDLTGSLLPTKMAREAKDTRDRTTQYFSDEWLSLKAKLYDGNVLRVSAVQKSKNRKSYWKRSRVSGKMKMKAEKFKGAAQEMKVRIVVNPQAYEIQASPNFKKGQNIGKFTIADLATNDGIINILAKSPFDEVDEKNILNFLKSAYSLLQRKAA